MIHYEKPKNRPEPSLQPSPTPGEIWPSNDDTSHAQAVELTYIMARSGVFSSLSGDTRVPPWSTYHAQITPNVEMDVATIAFNPIIMAPPNDHSTVYTTLKRLKEAINALGHKHAPITFDMGLLSKALEITWSRPDDLEDVIPWEGGMHLLFSVFAGIGYIYGGAGLSNLLHESGTYAAGSVQQMLSGRDFDPALRGFRLVDEAMNILFLRQFKIWCEAN